MNKYAEMQMGTYLCIFQILFSDTYLRFTYLGILMLTAQIATFDEMFILQQRQLIGF